MNIDLNEENYDYGKLLKLFSLSESFTKNDLKLAKKKVSMLHPDKSKCSNDIFIFMLKMYHKLEEIHNYTNNDKNIKNLTAQHEVNDHFKKYLHFKKIDPVENYKEFSKEFNKMFENVYISENNNGYSEWLKSDDEMYDKNNLEKSRRRAINKNMELVEVKNIEEVGENISTQHSDIKECYSNLFFSFDVNKEFEKKKKFKNVQEYQMYVSQEDNTPLDKMNSLKYFEKNEQSLNNSAKIIAFNSIKNKESMEKKYKDYISNYLKLDN
jgi:hypothetical protein